jgi:SAM-dependent methyltransferase
VSETTSAQVNAAVWQRLYAAGSNDLRYPSDILIRLGARVLDRARDRRILDFGFGTGANMLHFAGQGFEMYGAEISEHALTRTRERFQATGLAGDLRLIEPGQRLPFASGYFDVVYAWQVLCYNDAQGWASTVSELERVARQGGLVIIATAAPGDISQVEAEPLGNSVYRSRVRGQEGCVLLIPERNALGGLFPDRQLEIGEFGYSFAGVTARYWIIIYRTPST